MTQQRAANSADINLGAGTMVGALALLLAGALTVNQTANFLHVRVPEDTIPLMWFGAAVIAVMCVALDIVRDTSRRNAAVKATKVYYEQFAGPVLHWEDAERLAASHMRSFGFSDARTTPAGADGGLDVVSHWGAAQVKFFSNPVGRPDVQKLRGAAHGQQRALFYAMSGYTPSAVEFADQAQVALWQFDQYGRVWPVNGLAKAYRKPEAANA